MFEIVSDVCEFYGVKESSLIELYGFRYFVIKKTELKDQNPIQVFLDFTQQSISLVNPM